MAGKAKYTKVRSNAGETAEDESRIGNIQIVRQIIDGPDRVRGVKEMS